MYRILTIALMVLAIATPAEAINKCFGVDGKAVYQDAPCAGRGETIVVRPASGHRAAVAAASEPSPNNVISPSVKGAAKKEGAFGETWQRRTFLENRGIRDARAEIEAHRRTCAAQQADLTSKKTRSMNNLAGATWEQSISTEMQAAATICDGRARDLRANLEALEKELRELQTK